MTTFIRRIILLLLVFSLLSVIAITIPRQLFSDTTLEFWAADGYGSYQYYYDYRSASLYLNKQWVLGTQIAPNGEFGLIINRVRRSILIDYVTPDGETERLGEFPVNPVDLVIEWSSDSESIYLIERSDETVSVYSIELASLELALVIEFENQAADNFGFSYDAETDLVIIQFFNFTDVSTFQLYEIGTGEAWTIQEHFVIPIEGWKEYFSFVEPDNHDEPSELFYVSLDEDIRESLPIPPQGEIVSISLMENEKYLLIATVEPYTSYLLDLDTKEYSQLDTDAPLIPLLWSSDGTFTLALDQRFVNNGGGGSMPWYKMDLETYEVEHLFDRYNFLLIRNLTGMVISPDNTQLAVVTTDRITAMSSLEISSLLTGERLHRFVYPQNKLVPVTTNIDSILGWYSP